MPSRREIHSKQATQAFFSATPPPARDHVETVHPCGQADSPSMTTGTAGVYHGLHPPSTITISAPSSSSAVSPLSSVPEPQSTSRTTPALAAAAAREKACSIFNTNLEERILAEEADTDLALDRANLGKSFAMEGFEEEMAHVRGSSRRAGYGS